MWLCLIKEADLEPHKNLPKKLPLRNESFVSMNITKENVMLVKIENGVPLDPPFLTYLFEEKKYRNMHFKNTPS